MKSVKRSISCLRGRMRGGAGCEIVTRGRIGPTTMVSVSAARRSARCDGPIASAIFWVGMLVTMRRTFTFRYLTVDNALPSFTPACHRNVLHTLVSAHRLTSARRRSTLPRVPSTSLSQAKSRLWFPLGSSPSHFLRHD